LPIKYGNLRRKSLALKNCNKLNKYEGQNKGQIGGIQRKGKKKGNSKGNERYDKKGALNTLK
jgi:hypothetical protein